MSGVELSVRSSLQKVIDELQKIKEEARETGAAFKQQADGVGEGLNRNVKQTETFFGQLRSLSRRVADQLRGDFKSLLSLGALQDAMKLSNLFRQNLSETIQLSDTVRKLGHTFGVVGDNFADFQAKMTEGLGEIGLSADVATNALKGLSQTPVRGQQNLLEYSKSAGMLASIGGERGREGDIAKALSDVIQARGRNVNDPREQVALAETVRKLFNSTGMSPTEVLTKMQALFAHMPEDFRKSITNSGLAEVLIAGAKGGPNASKFIEDLLGSSPLMRAKIEALGGGGLVGPKGLNLDKFQKFAEYIFSLNPLDKRAAAKIATNGDDEAAEGFVRLYENIKQAKTGVAGFTRDFDTLQQQFQSSMGAAEAFNASLNRLKANLAKPLSMATQKGTDLLSHAAQSDLGAGAVVGGGALVAAILAGLGLKGVGAGVQRGLAGLGAAGARIEGAEAALGAKTIPVYVVNVDEFGNATGSALGNLLGGGAGAGAVAAEGGAAAAGGTIATLGAMALPVILGKMVLDQIFEAGENDIKNAGKRPQDVTYTPEMLQTLEKALNAGKLAPERAKQVREILTASGMAPGATAGQSQFSGRGPAGSGGSAAGPAPQQNVRVIVETRDQNLKTTVQAPRRGAPN